MYWLLWWSGHLGYPDAWFPVRGPAVVVVVRVAPAVVEPTGDRGDHRRQAGQGEQQGGAADLPGNLQTRWWKV